MNKLDDIINEIANEQIPEDRMEQAAGRVRQKLFAHTAKAPDHIRSCADYQALIPSYLNKTLSAGRALLLQDHTRECVACRHALQQARSESAPTLIRPATPPSRTIPRQWAIAAAALVTVALGAVILIENMGVFSKRTRRRADRLRNPLHGLGSRQHAGVSGSRDRGWPASSHGERLEGRRSTRRRLAG